jgi:hypothetical protein
MVKSFVKHVSARLDPMIRILVAAPLLLALAAPALGQPRIEVLVAGALPVREAQGTFTSDYTPALVNGGTATGGRAGQTLQIGAGRPRGFLLGVNWLITPRAGLQLTVDRASHAISGANAPNEVQLTYLTRQPPDYIEREYTYAQTTAWPDSRVAFTRWRMAASGLWRITGRRADLTLTGGVVFSRMQGHVDEASYLEFRLGGHSTIFYEEALARLRVDDTWRAGVNAGADLAIPLGRRVAVTAGVRLAASPSTIAITPEILNADRMIFEIPLERVQEHLGTHPIRMRQWDTPVLTVGVRLR